MGSSTIVDNIDGEHELVQPDQADSHDLIRVQGARQNNLKDVVEIPKRADGVYRRLGIGQVVAGVRYHRRRVAAADQRNLQRLRADSCRRWPARGGRPRRADGVRPVTALAITPTLQ